LIEAVESLGSETIQLLSVGHYLMLNLE